MRDVTAQPRIFRESTQPCLGPESDSDEWTNCQSLGQRFKEAQASAAAPGNSVDSVRLVESSRSVTRTNINAVRCLGIVRSKGTRRGAQPSRKNDLKKGHAVNTTWGPCVLKEKCKSGWNCDFRDDRPGGWYVEYKDMLLGTS